MINVSEIKKGINIKESKILNKMKEQGENKMYNYLSGNDPDSSYTGENVKNIMTLAGNIKWENVEDPSNALFSIGYSEQGNIIGILTNANALLQDMLLYCTLADAKKNLTTILNIGVGSKPMLGKRYAINGKSPLTFALPVVTSGGYKSYAVVIHNKHADEFIKILESLDIDSLTEEDMLLIAKDISFISRTQELAIDVAKDKTIQIVDTSQWLKMGVKPANYWLGQNKMTGDWLAKTNLFDILKAKKTGDLMPEFIIEEDIPEVIKTRVSAEAITSESIAREVLKKAVEDYYNNHYKEMLLYSQETELNITCKAMANEYKDLAISIKQVLRAYRSYMIDNMPKHAEDEETATLLRKISREKTEAFAVICRNTIYHLGLKAGYDYKTIAMVAYGTDLSAVSKDEGKYFRAVMPEEFKKLYAQGKTEIVKEKLFFVEELTQDAIDDGEVITVNFNKGKAYDEDGVLIARASLKYTANNCTLTFDETSGHFYAEQELGIDLPEFGDEILLRVDGMTSDIDLEDKKFKYTPKTSHNSNVVYLEDEYSKTFMGTLGYYGTMNIIEQAMLLNNSVITKFIQDGKTEEVKELLKSADRVRVANLVVDLAIKEIITVNKDNEYETNYAILTI